MMNGKRPRGLGASTWERHKRLADEAVALLGRRPMRGRPTSRALLDLLARLRHEQDEYKPIPFGELRLLNDRDLAVIEHALSATAFPERAPYDVYDAASLLCDEYDPRYPSGLNPKSAPAVQVIADFWVQRFGLDHAEHGADGDANVSRPKAVGRSAAPGATSASTRQATSNARPSKMTVKGEARARRSGAVSRPAAGLRLPDEGSRHAGFGEGQPDARAPRRAGEMMSTLNPERFWVARRELHGRAQGGQARDHAAGREGGERRRHRGKMIIAARGSPPRPRVACPTNAPGPPSASRPGIAIEQAVMQIAAVAKVLDPKVPGEEKTLIAVSHILLVRLRPQGGGDTAVSPPPWGSSTCIRCRLAGRGGPVGVSDTDALPDGQVSARSSPCPASEGCFACRGADNVELSILTRRGLRSSR
jgi:hypothetical protein